MDKFIPTGDPFPALLPRMPAGAFIRLKDTHYPLLQFMAYTRGNGFSAKHPEGYRLFLPVASIASVILQLPSFVTEYATVCGPLSCGMCGSVDVMTYGEVELDGAGGFYVNILCNKCRTDGQDGDGDFFRFYKFEPRGIVRLDEMETNEEEQA